MPQDSGTPSVKVSQSKNKHANVARMRSHTESEIQAFPYCKSEGEADSILNPALRGRLYELFGQIEREFENLYSENLALHERVETLNEKLEKELYLSSLDNRAADLVDSETGAHKAVSKQKSSQATNLIKTTHKLKAQTSKIVSSFKGSILTTNLSREYIGHRDGVWEVSVSKTGQQILGTASADHTARIWGAESGLCLLQYVGHGGSVNSIRFHPLQELVVTASGDSTAHIWRVNVHSPAVIEQTHAHSSEDELSEKEEKSLEDAEQLPEGSILRTPMSELTGHLGVVIAADWLTGGEQVITASWDRTANLYDVQTGELLHSLSGHDQELTYVSAHPTQRLGVTCSKDTTFRLWDFREPVHSVSVFQGHTESVTSATFASGDKVISGSDDRSTKLWDLKNMRAPLVTIRSDSPINRISVSAQQIIAIPHDNRNVRLYDLNGVRLARLPRNNRQGHRRMACATAWMDEPHGHPHINLFTCGFDRQVLGWTVIPTAKDGKD